MMDKKISHISRISRISRIICVVLAAVLLTGLFPGYGQAAGIQPHEPGKFTSYKDIPGVTEEEIKAIDALREQVDHFVYSVLPTTEAFYDSNGDIRGWTTLFCEWMTEFFGIPFKPQFVAWGDYLSTLASFEVDFTGHLTATEERRKIYFMTTGIAQNVVRSYRLVDSIPLEYIAQARPPRYAFIEGSVTAQEVTSSLVPGTYEIIWVNDYPDAYQVLAKGGADAFITTSVAEASFIDYGNIIIEDFI